MLISVMNYLSHIWKISVIKTRDLLPVFLKYANLTEVYP